MSNNWYNERNKRTDSFAEVNENCHKTKVHVIVTASINDYDTQVMFIILLNILARWCNNINIICDEGVNLLCPQNKDSGIVATAKQLVTEIDPHGIFTFNERAGYEADISVFIGPPPLSPSTPYVAIDGHGWIGSCSFNGSPICDRFTSSRNPIGPAFAACLANAELFRWANQIYSTAYNKWYSLFDFSIEESIIPDKMELAQVDLSRVHVVGCGAIGSSFTYLLNLINLTGNLTFCDADTGVETHNTSSSLLFTTHSLSPDKTKAEICSEFVKATSYKVNPPFNGDYTNFGYNHDLPLKSADVILCFANDHNIWSTIQHLYPPVVFHATTSRSWGINVGRHIPLKDNCLMCTFQGIAEMKYVPKCAEGEIPNEQKSSNAEVAVKTEDPHASILPFLSPAAAIITMAELMKLLTGKVSNENTTEFNMSTKDGIFIENQHRAKDCYICKDQSPSIYKGLHIRLEF